MNGDKLTRRRSPGEVIPVNPVQLFLTVEYSVLGAALVVAFIVSLRIGAWRRHR